MRINMGKFFLHRYNWIKKNSEVGPNRIISLHHHCRCKMATSREANNSDIISIEVPFFSTTSHHLDSFFPICHRTIKILLWHSIFQHSRNIPSQIKIREPTIPFVPFLQITIPTTRAYNNSAIYMIIPVIG